ncbi:unnamed protein product [Caenorhabditis angaria]|uniref:Uncharacterized protein n=1 Tax=Caenorhabditis angaria TaxID=860376 RepID=A0A9P1MYQ0_9PELO|nr:unnamed protein product [Caenorhabditis angaria]
MFINFKTTVTLLILVQHPIFCTANSNCAEIKGTAVEAVMKNVCKLCFEKFLIPVGKCEENCFKTEVYKNCHEKFSTKKKEEQKCD